MVFVLFLMGVSSLKEFALTLMVGVVGGAFSSVFLTGPLWYLMKTRFGKDRYVTVEKATENEVGQKQKITANPNRKKKKKKRKK